MSSTSVKLPLEYSRSVKELLESKGFKERAVNNTLWSMSDGKTHVNLYNTGTLLLQGKEAQRLKEEILKLVELPKASLVGCDESGKGDVFGGLVVCCVVIEPQAYRRVLSLTPQDSKRLNDEAILKKAAQLSKEVKAKCLNVFPETYNALYTQRPNVNDILTALYKRLIREILKKHGVEEVVVDRYSSRELFSEFPEVKFITKAENEPAVAAASILARAGFLRQLGELKKLAGFKVPKGSGPEAFKRAMEVIKRGGDLPQRLLKMNFLMGAGGLEPPTGRL